MGAIRSFLLVSPSDNDALYQKVEIEAAAKLLIIIDDRNENKVQETLWRFLTNIQKMDIDIAIFEVSSL